MNTKKFKPGKRITIFFVFFALLFFVLGLWQIERGQGKTGIIDEFNANSSNYINRKVKFSRDSSA